MSENYFLSVSATTTSQTKNLPKAAASVMLENDSASANIAHAVLFDEHDVAQGKTRAATTSDTPLGIAKSKTWPRGAGQPQWAAVSIISAGTSTVTIDAD